MASKQFMDLDSDPVNEFWNFIAERQSIWHKRVIEQQDYPWTDNEILKNYRFTNVYRELDPGTQYAIQNIMIRDESRKDRTFNIMIYRLLGRKETHERLDFRSSEDFDPEGFERVLKKRRESGKPVFTGAYMVSGYSQFDSSDKVENISEIFKRISQDFDETFETIDSAQSPQEVYNIINSLPGFGNFLSYQVLVDLLYDLGEEPSVIEFNHNEWAKPGPGAKKGLKVLAENPGPDERLEIMRWLTENQESEFRDRGIDFNYLKDTEGRRRLLSLADIQNCLCEFYKFHKIKNDKGRARRKFRSSNSRGNSNLRKIYKEAPKISLK
ncbi:MAG: hypothetical protein H8Z69_03165 [Nanohaloarchaea archaeon]|nr:hypothetical protein [Candidatus Nanohaloarchaea archaeon]